MGLLQLVGYGVAERACVYGYLAKGALQSAPYNICLSTDALHVVQKVMTTWPERVRNG